MSFDTKYWLYIQLIKEDNEMLQTVRFYEQFFLRLIKIKMYSV